MEKPISIELQKVGNIATVEIDQILKDLFDVVQSVSDTRISLIGSTVRMMLDANTSPRKDYDFVGVYDFEAIARSGIFDVVSQHPKYGVMKVKFHGMDIDLIHSASIVDALSSRDITVSLFAMSSNGDVYDPLGCRQDYENRIVRMINPEVKLEIDPVRAIRVFRFAAELGYTIDEETLIACRSLDREITARKARFETAKIQSMGADARARIITLMSDWGFQERFASVMNEKALGLIHEHLQLNKAIHFVSKLFGSENFYVFGGAIRDIIRETNVGDFDFKFVGVPLVYQRQLEERGFVETDDISLPEGTYYFNRRFGAISIRVDGIVYDFTFIERPPESREWYSRCDVNMNALVYDNGAGILINPELVVEVMLGFLKICNTEKVDPLVFTNFLKLIAKNQGLVVDEQSLRLANDSMPAIVEFFERDERMRYKLMSILDRPNTSETLKLLSSIPYGERLFGILES